MQRRVLVAMLELAAHDSQRAQRYAHLKPCAPVELGQHVIAERAASSVDQLDCGRAVVESGFGRERSALLGIRVDRSAVRLARGPRVE